MSNYIHYIFPKRCAVCGTVINHNEQLCADCRGNIKPIQVKRCLRCGLPKTRCECRRYAYHFRRIVSPFLNKDEAQRAVYGFKFGKNRDAAEFFARYMSALIREHFGDITFDCVTAVPMHPLKRRVTGFDHAEIIAKAVARQMGLPYKRLLRKIRKNQTQHTLNARERFHNVKNAYTAKKNSYRAVLLIDDIKTTGATLDECSRRLMLSGCESVYCATVVVGT